MVTLKKGLGYTVSGMFTDKLLESRIKFPDIISHLLYLIKVLYLNV